MYRNMPWDNPFGAEGKPVNPRNSDVVWYGRDMSNYLYDLQWNYGETSSLDMIANFDIEYDISKHFKFVSTNSVTTMFGNSYYYTDPQSIAGEAMIGNINQSKSTGVNRFTNQMLNAIQTVQSTCESRQTDLAGLDGNRAPRFQIGDFVKITLDKGNQIVVRPKLPLVQRASVWQRQIEPSARNLRRIACLTNRRQIRRQCVEVAQIISSTRPTT